MAQEIISVGFHGVQFETVTRDNEPWLRTNQIGLALGYGQRGDQIDAPFADKAIRKLYARHADEFTASMTAVVTLSTPGGPQETRIFSLRGCHLLAMFARTQVAKAFRVWVLDILEALNKEQAPQQSKALVWQPMHSDRKPIESKWLSVKQAAEYLGCSKAFLDRDRTTRLHNIPFARLGRHIRYYQDNLDEFLFSQEVR